MFPTHRIMTLIRSIGLSGILLLLPLTTETSAGAESNTIDAATAVSRRSLRGVLMPLRSLQLSSRAAGVVEKFGAEEGQYVAADDLLVQLNADIERADVARAEAILESANGEWERTRRELERTKKLRQDSIGSEKDLDDANYMHLLATGRRKQATADLEMANARLKERAIYAPMSGLLFRRSRGIGEAVERLEIVVRLIDASKLELVVYAGAELLGKFKEGQSTRLTVDSGPATGSQITGTVSQVDPTMDPVSSTFRIKVQVAPTDKLQPGISVTLQIPSEVN